MTGVSEQPIDSNGDTSHTKLRTARKPGHLPVSAEPNPLVYSATTEQYLPAEAGEAAPEECGSLVVPHVAAAPARATTPLSTNDFPDAQALGVRIEEPTPTGGNNLTAMQQDAQKQQQSETDIQYATEHQGQDAQVPSVQQTDQIQVEVVTEQHRGLPAIEQGIAQNTLSYVGIAPVDGRRSDDCPEITTHATGIHVDSQAKTVQSYDSVLQRLTVLFEQGLLTTAEFQQLLAEAQERIDVTSRQDVSKISPLRHAETPLPQPNLSVDAATSSVADDALDTSTTTVTPDWLHDGVVDQLSATQIAEQERAQKLHVEGLLSASEFQILMQHVKQRIDATSRFAPVTAESITIDIAKQQQRDKLDQLLEEHFLSQQEYEHLRTQLDN